MKYLSTVASVESASSLEALLYSEAKDGGLWVPDTLPFYDREALRTLRSRPFSERVARVLADLLPELSLAELRSLVRESLVTEEGKELCPLFPLNPYLPNEYLAELWHGPTASSLDLTAGIFLRLLKLAREKNREQRPLLLLVADEGNVAAALLAAASNVFEEGEARFLILSPEKGTSPVQRGLLATLAEEREESCEILPMSTNFDENYRLLKRLLREEGEKDFHLVLANDEHWGQMATRIAILLALYLEGQEKAFFEEEEGVNLVLPSGTLGLLMAAWYARRMGLPLHRLVCASNRNKVVPDFFSSGKYEIRRELARSQAPSMDILYAPNLERLLFELSGHQAERVARHMEALETKGETQVEADLLRRMQAVFVGGFTDHAGMLRSLREVYDRYDLAVDSHTAIGFNVYARYLQRSKDGHKVLYLAVGSPYKTVEPVCQAIFEEKRKKPTANLLVDLEAEIGEALPRSLQEAFHLALQRIEAAEESEFTGSRGIENPVSALTPAELVAMWDRGETYPQYRPRPGELAEFTEDHKLRRRDPEPRWRYLAPNPAVPNSEAVKEEVKGDEKKLESEATGATAEAERPLLRSQEAGQYLRELLARWR